MENKIIRKKTATHGSVQLRNHLTHASITIGKTPAELFSFFRDFSNLPKFMKDLKSVAVVDSQTSKWTVELKSGRSASWTAVIEREVENEMIAWRSVEGSEIETFGDIHFTEAPAGLGTVVELLLDFKIPGGKLGELFTFFTSEHPKELLLTNLRRLKAVMETGEYPTTEGQPSGREELSPALH